MSADNFLNMCYLLAWGQRNSGMEVDNVSNREMYDGDNDRTPNNENKNWENGCDRSARARTGLKPVYVSLISNILWKDKRNHNHDTCTAKTWTAIEESC